MFLNAVCSYGFFIDWWGLFCLFVFRFYPIPIVVNPLATNNNYYPQHSVHIVIALWLIGVGWCWWSYFMMIQTKQQVRLISLLIYIVFIIVAHTEITYKCFCCGVKFIVGDFISTCNYYAVTRECILAGWSEKW